MNGSHAATMPAIAIHRGHECVRSRWKNGLGWTREVARGGLASQVRPDDGGWDWRLSIAEIDADAEFSRFPGVDRMLTLLSGNGVRLQGGGEGRLGEALPPHGAIRFPGEAAVLGCLVEGRVQVLNLMWRREVVSADAWFRPLVGPMLVFADPGETWLLHLVSGQARLDRDLDMPMLEAGDSVVLAARDTRLRCLLEGGGEVVVARLAPASPQ